MRKTAVLLALMAMSMSDAFAATAGTPIASTNYVDEALESLNAAKMGANGSYIQYVSETNGIVSATPKAFDSAMSSTSINAVQNKVVNTELGKKQDTLVPGTNIKGSNSVAVTKTDGVIIVSGVVDTELSSTSTNPVQNMVVNTALGNKQDNLTTAQLDAANSGITANKVATYDAYATGKQATLTTSNVTSTGGGNVVTAVTASNGTVTVTKGTTLGSLATKSAVGSSDITDGGVALADLASSSVNSAKIVDGSIATVDIANGAVTAVKTTGIFGFIPSGSEGSSTTATIWVE